MHGFLNIDKPTGITSYDVIRQIKKVIPKQVKIGHLGTLDPMASGVLPVALGKATRIIPYLDNDRKAYIAQLTLGAVADTQDIWGQISYTGNNKFHREQMQAIIAEFTGKIKQVPPMYSSVHHQGKRLYELARQGITVDREEREIVIYSLEILEIEEGSDLPWLTIRVECSRGTYIRTLCHDIGAKLGTGGLLSKLTRIQSGAFNIENACPLQQLTADRQSWSNYLLPLDYPLSSIPAISVEGQDVEAVLNGRTITIKESIADGLIRLYAPGKELIALARSAKEQGIIKPERVLK